MNLIMLLLAHALMLYLVVYLPLLPLLARLGWIPYRPRTSLYLWWMLRSWGALVFMIVIVAGLGWSPQVLGLRPPTNLLLAVFLGGAPLAFLVALALLFRLVPRLDAKRRELLRTQQHATQLLPHTPKERLLFGLVCVTAGLCEELLFRGFLPAYLMRIFPGTSFVLALVLSALFFGLIHSSLKAVGMVGNGIMGLLYGLLYFLTASIFPCILIHILFDARLLLNDFSGEVDPAQLSKEAT